MWRFTFYATLSALAMAFGLMFIVDPNIASLALYDTATPLSKSAIRTQGFLTALWGGHILDRTGLKHATLMPPLIALGATVAYSLDDTLTMLFRILIPILTGLCTVGYVAIDLILPWCRPSSRG